MAIEGVGKGVLIFRNEWVVTVDNESFHVKVSRSLGFVRVWVNGALVKTKWQYDTGKPVSIPLGKSTADFSRFNQGYAYQLTLNDKPLFPKYIGEQFTLPRSRAWISIIGEILTYCLFSVLLGVWLHFFLPIYPSSIIINFIIGQSILLLAVILKLNQVIRIFSPPPTFDPAGFSYLGRNIRWIEINRVGLDSLGALVIEGEYEKIVIPPRLSSDTPVLARWVEEKTGHSVQSIVPVTVTWVWKHAPFIVGLLGFIAAIGLLWTPWWVIGIGLSIGMLIGWLDVDNLVKGPLRSCYTLLGIVFLIVSILVQYYWLSVVIGVMFATVSAFLGFAFAIRALPNFLDAVKNHDASV